MHRTRVIALATLASTALLAALPNVATADELKVVNGWISLPIGREDPSLYFVIQSKSAETQTLVGATSPRCESIAIRRTAVVDGQWSSVGMPEGMAVPAGGAVAFAPRGLFLRMSGAEKFAEGDAVPVELEFASGLKVAFTATAKDE